MIPKKTLTTVVFVLLVFSNLTLISAQRTPQDLLGYNYIEELKLLTPKGVRLKSIYYLDTSKTGLLLDVMDGKLKFNLRKSLDFWSMPLNYPRYKVRVEGRGITSAFADLKEYIGVSNVRSKGLTGEGIVVGVVDTGVDFAAPTLGLEAVARDESGKPLTLDADQLGFALTPLEARLASNVSRMLDVKDKTVEVYIPLGIIAEFEVEYSWTAPPIPSKSGVYKFGFLVEFSTFYNSIFEASAPAIGYLIPVVLVDTTEPGVYDTVYLDLSSTWFLVGAYLYSLGVLASPPSITFLDFSFANELPLRYGSELAAKDVDGDGDYDFSAGIISGYVYDAFGLIGAVEEEARPYWKYAWEYVGSGIYPGLDSKGRYVDFFYDPIGHGTSVASIIAGRNYTYTYPGVFGLPNIEFEGIAPRAKIAGSTAVYAGDVITAQLWLSGHNYSKPWNWTYTGKPRVDVINNSWGLLQWYILSAYGVETFAPGVDPISEYEDYIVENTGTIIVHAAGNQGPGYGTVSVGGTSRLALTVGASTFLTGDIYFWDGDLMLPEAVEDQVISWSSRGPLPYTQVKPDLVAPGAYAVVPTSVMGGLGDGGRAVDVFGGTSMASPIVAGSIALLLEFAQRNNVELEYWAIKALLKSTADPLGFDPYTEGSGRLNVTKALNALMRGFKGVVVSETTLPYNPIPLRREDKITFRDSTLYIYYRPGNKTYKTVEAYGFNNPPKVRAYTYTKVYRKEVGKFQAIHGKYTPIIIPREALKSDLVTIIISYNVSEFLPGGRNGDYTPKDALIAFLGYWRDLNNNSRIEFRDEFQFLTHSPGIANYIVLEVSNIKPPEDSFLALAIKSVSRTNFTTRVEVQAYNLTELSWFTVTGVKKSKWGYYITLELKDVPEAPGFYEGYLEFESDSIKSRMPFQLAVPIFLVSRGSLKLSYGESGFKYENWVLESPSVYGTPSSGEWRFYIVESAGREVALTVETSWKSINSSIEALGLSDKGEVRSLLISGRLSSTGLLTIIPSYTSTYYVKNNVSTMIVPQLGGSYLIALHYTISFGGRETAMLRLAPIKVKYRIARSGLAHAIITCDLPLGPFKLKVGKWSITREHRGGMISVPIPLTKEKAELELLEQPTILFQAEIWGLTYTLYVKKTVIQLEFRPITIEDDAWKERLRPT